uniref:Uncharacterized protein n=1 Tax=Triticum urartu TaxID=4572 RepID=A0A8R7R1P4_TRIUA
MSIRALVQMYFRCIQVQVVNSSLTNRPALSYSNLPQLPPPLSTGAEQGCAAATSSPDTSLMLLLGLVSDIYFSNARSQKETRLDICSWKCFWWQHGVYGKRELLDPLLADLSSPSPANFSM